MHTLVEFREIFSGNFGWLNSTLKIIQNDTNITYEIYNFQIGNRLFNFYVGETVSDDARFWDNGFKFDAIPPWWKYPDGTSRILNGVFGINFRLLDDHDWSWLIMIICTGWLIIN